MKKLLLIALMLVVLSACSDETDSPKLAEPQLEETSSIPISEGIYHTGDLIFKDGSDKYYFGGFLNETENILSVVVAYYEGTTAGHSQEYNYVFSKDSTFKLNNGVVLKMVEWDKSKNEIRLEQLTTK